MQDHDIIYGTIGYLTKNFMHLRGYASASFGLVPLAITLRDILDLRLDTGVFYLGFRGTKGSFSPHINATFDVLSWCMVCFGLIMWAFLRYRYYPRYFGELSRPKNTNVFNSNDLRRIAGIVGFSVAFGVTIVIDEHLALPINLAILVVSFGFYLRAKSAPTMRHTFYTQTIFLLILAFFIPIIPRPEGFDINPYFALTMCFIFIADGITSHHLLVNLLQLNQSKVAK